VVALAIAAEMQRPGQRAVVVLAIAAEVEQLLQKAAVVALPGGLGAAVDVVDRT